MRFEALRERVCEVNRVLGESGLVLFTWGNASAVDREEGVLAIKPSGVDYESLEPEMIPIVALESGEVVDGTTKPSSDTPTHRYLYQQFDPIGGIVHTHSRCASSWAQACRPLPCLGTTHADFFYGDVPLARELSEEETESDYEWNTGVAIVDAFDLERRDPIEMPAVLVPGHAPFCWGTSPEKALENAIVLERVAEMALHTVMLGQNADTLPQHILEKHHLRKHGPSAYYGQG